MGHSYAVGFRMYEFPSCRTIFEMDFEDWNDVEDRLRRVYQDAAKPNGSRHLDFTKNRWTKNDRLAFSPDGRTLLFGTIKGEVLGVALEDTSKPSGVWTVHDGPVLALDVPTPHAVLATAGCDGEIKLWKLDGEGSTPGANGKRMTQAFLDKNKPTDSMAAHDEFRTTDGKRWYDFETIDEDELDDDAPAWAQLAKWRRERERLSE
jgi:hypothetical protein